MPWGARMEGAEEQKRRADHVQPPEQDLDSEAFSDVHAASPDVRKTGYAALHQSQELRGRFFGSRSSGSLAVGSGMMARQPSCSEVSHVAPPERSPSPAHSG